MTPFKAVVWLLPILFMVFNGCKPEPETRTIAIIKWVTHPALDELESGFLDVVKPAIGNDPKLQGFQIDPYDAEQNDGKAKTLAVACKPPGVKLILAIGTPAAQAVAKTSTSIPLLYGAVASPEGAKLIPSPRVTGIKNSGPHIIHEALVFIKTMFPNATRIGSLYNPAEQNSQYVQDLIRSECDKPEFKKFQLIQRTVNGPSQVPSQTEELASEVDVIYSANDNTVNRAVASVVAIAKSKSIPFVLGDLSTLSKGALAAVGLEYKSMGRSLGNMAIAIINGKPISDFPPQEAPAPEIWINRGTLTYLGLKVPDALKDKVKVIDPKAFP